MKEYDIKKKVWSASKEVNVASLFSELEQRDAVIASRLEQLAEAIATHNAIRGRKPRKEFFMVMHDLLIDVDTFMVEDE